MRDVVRTGDIVTIRHGRWRVVRTVPHDTATAVEALGCGASNRAERATFLLPFEPFAPVDARRPVVVGSRRWRRVARQILSDTGGAWWSLTRATDAAFDVLPYQLAPALALSRGDACRFLLADAVGLGKTVQAALMVAETLARWPDARAIVVCPAGLREQWREELRRRFQIDTQIVEAATLARLASELPPTVNPWSVHGVVITSIDYVKRPEVARALEALVWDVAIFDEAHNLAGRSDRATAASLVAGRARHVVLLTATPHSGDAAAFERLCAIGSLGDDPLLVFRRTRSTIGLAARARMRCLHIRPTADERRLHDALNAYVRQVWTRRGTRDGARLAMMVLMRRACSSPAALARSIERRIAYLESGVAGISPGPALPFGWSDEEPDGVLGAPGLADPQTERDTLRLLLERARRASTADSKLRAVRRLLRRIAEPAILFTEYRDTLEDLARIFSGSRSLALHGALTPRERRDVIREFTAGNAQLLLSTDAGSEGLNLQHRCRIVINLELPWMPRRLEQRGGRVDRIGQKRQVHIVNLVAAGTSEETVLARLVTRQAYAHDALQQLTSPSEEDIASAMLNGNAPAADEAPMLLPRNVVAATALTGALEEAARIVTARDMLSRSAPAGERAMLARVRRSDRQRPRQCLWLLTAACASSAALHLRDAALGCRADVEAPANRSRSQIRRLLDPQRVLSSAAVTRHLEQLEIEMRDELAAASRRWCRREEAILRHLTEQHARLSRTLVQSGLFDHRVERLADAHNEALHAVTSRCEERIATLRALLHVRLDEPSCLFGVWLA